MAAVKEPHALEPAPRRGDFQLLKSLISSPGLYQGHIGRARPGGMTSWTAQQRWSARRLLAKAKGSPHSQMRGRWRRLQRNTTTFGEGGSHPFGLKPRLGPEKGRFTGAKPIGSKTGRAGHPRGEHPRLSLAPSRGVMAPQPSASQSQLRETGRTSGQESPRA